MAHYKEVLATTETMLTSLQSSVETAETEWKLKLEVANKCVFGSFITIQIIINKCNCRELTDLKVEKSSLQTSHINTSQVYHHIMNAEQLSCTSNTFEFVLFRLYAICMHDKVQY